MFHPARLWRNLLVLTGLAVNDAQVMVENEHS
jgi:hypothetical protein